MIMFKYDDEIKYLPKYISAKCITCSAMVINNVSFKKLCENHDSHKILSSFNNEFYIL
jgi:hypothetical protein